jgi:hypothetical protein
MPGGTQRGRSTDDRDRARWKGCVITGWREWVIAAVAVVATTAVLAALAFLVLGIAVSMAAFLLIIIPAVAMVVLTAWFFQLRRA